MKKIYHIILFFLVLNVNSFAQVNFQNNVISTSKVEKIVPKSKSIVSKETTQQVSIGNYVWFDHNQNGLQDFGELGLYGINVYLYNNSNCSGTAMQSTKTSDIGYYRFTDIPSSGTKYCIAIQYPQFWTHSQVGTGFSDVDSNLEDMNPAMGKIPNISLRENQTLDAGLYHKNKNCRTSSLSENEVGVYDNRNSWAKRASLDVEFDNVIASGFCHEYTNRGPLRGEKYTAHTTDRVGFTTEQIDKLTRIFRFESDPEVLDLINMTFKDKNMQIYFNVISNAFVWYYSDWNLDFSKVKNYIVSSSWSKNLSENEKKSLISISHLIIDKIEGNNGKTQYEPMKVYYLWNEDNDKHQDIIVPETWVVPKNRACEVSAKNSKLGDFVWFDADKNGEQTKGEVGLSGVKVELFDGQNKLLSSTTTDGEGFYHFSQLEAGEYVVKFSTKEGYSLTKKEKEGVLPSLNSDANPKTGLSNVITLSTDEENLNIDAGMYITPQAKINVVKTTNNGHVENILVGDTVTWTYVVSNVGNQVLSNITLLDDKEGSITECVGSGSLEALMPTKSLTCTKQGSAILGQYVNKVTVTAKGEDGKVVKAEDSSSYEGKETPVKLGSVGDYVWFDSNYDGIQNSNELPLSKISVQLYSENHKLIASTKTNNKGAYNFKDLTQGKYYIKFLIPSAYSVTKIGEGKDKAKDSDADKNGKTALFTLADGENKTDIDLGLYPTLANLGDKVWFDVNGNGIQESNETKGVPNVTVKLYSEANKLIGTTQTTTTGQYLFSNLIPGNYYVLFEVPNNYKVSPLKQGSNSSNDSDANPKTGKTAVFTLFAGRDEKRIDMGLYQERTKIGDRVFYDMNKNGVQDKGENGVGNVVVKLFDAKTSELVAQTKTSALGIYLFEDLLAGEYYIEFVVPAGYTITDSGKGTNENDSNPDKNGRTENFTIVAGTQDSTIDMGIYQNLVSYGDRVFLDTNHNGLQDIGEKGVKNIKVTIFSANSDFKKSMLTDENGNYLFTHLPAGEYRAEFSDIPYGYLISEKDVNNNNNDLNDSDGFLKDEKIITEVALLTAGTNDLSWDLGIYKTVCLPGKSVLGDLVWEDLNKDGVQDIGERGIPNVSVTLYNNDTDEKVGTTVTDENGLYEFTNLDPDFNYYVQFKVPSGYVVSPQHQDVETIDSDADATGKTDVITLIADKINSTVDMGLYHQGATIGDRVFFDDFNDISNGIQDLGEQGVVDVKVTLYNAQGESIKTTRTNANGQYHFTNLAKGNYTVGFSELPSGYIFTLRGKGNDREKDSDVKMNGRTGLIVVNGTETITSVDAGLKKVNSGLSSNDIKKGQTGKNVTLDVLANDVEGSYPFDPQTVKITSTPQGATLSEDGRTLTVPNEGVWTVNPDTGAITFAPRNGFTGDPTPISYSVQDTQGNETSADVEVDYPPLAQDDTVNGQVGQQIVVFVLENDVATSTPLDVTSLRLIDPTTGDLVETIMIQGEGTWSTNVNGSITFTPDESLVTNPTSIEYVVREVNGDVSNRATIHITYPDAVDDIVIIPTNETGSINVNVAENDSNNTVANTVTIGCTQAGTQTLTVANEGTWNVNEDGTITFVPLSGFLADPTDIQYTIGLVSGERSNCARVDLRHELLAVDDIATLNVGGVSIINILSNDSGVLNQASVRLVLPTNPVAGTTLSDDGKRITVPSEGVWTVDNRGNVTFTAEEGFVVAPTPIRYSVENIDGVRSNIATITLTLGGVSITANDDTGVANGANPVAINVLDNDEGDINSSSVRFIDADGNEVTTLVVPNEGTWTVDSNGVVTFTGDSGYLGTPTPIRYVIHDNSAVLSDTATVNIDGICDCRPYEESVSSMGQMGIVLIVLLTMLLSMLFFKEEEFDLIK